MNIASIFQKFSSSSIEDEKDIIYNNIIGFMSISGGSGATTFMCEVYRVLAQTDKTICLIDFNTSRPKVCTYLNIMHPQETMGLSAALINPLNDPNEYTIELEPKKSRILCASLLEPPEEFVDADEDNLKSMISHLAEKYDLVLIDIPPDCFSEFTLASLLKVHRLFCFVDDVIDTIPILTKYSKYYQSIGIVDKFKNIIINKIAVDEYPLDPVKSQNYNIIAALKYSSFIAKFQSSGYSVTGGVYKDKEVKAYISAVEYVANMILSKTGGDLADVNERQDNEVETE